MTRLSDLVMVVRLAALTEDRDRAEQGALERVAKSVDREFNKQTQSNKNLPEPARYRMWVSYAHGVNDGPACSYSSEHGKSCVCRGSGVALEPVEGWSRLYDEVRVAPSVEAAQ